jgi:peroxiredoxin
MNKKLLPLLNLMLTRTALLLALWAALAGTAQAAAPAPGSLAPDFTLRTGSGPNLRLSEQRGKVVLLNFWATWCGPCREEMPHLNRLHEKYKASGFTLLGVNIDDDSRAALALATKLGVGFPVLLDADKSTSRLYDLGAMPSTVLIDRDGKVRYLHRGYRGGFEQTYEQQIRELLRE